MMSRLLIVLATLMGVTTSCASCAEDDLICQIEAAKDWDYLVANLIKLAFLALILLLITHLIRRLRAAILLRKPTIRQIVSEWKSKGWTVEVSSDIDSYFEFFHPCPKMTLMAYTCPFKGEHHHFHGQYYERLGNGSLGEFEVFDIEIRLTPKCDKCAHAIEK